MGQNPIARFDRPGSASQVSARFSRGVSFERPASPLRARGFETIFWGGLIAGFLDGMDAVVWVTLNGISVSRLFKFIASGWMGLRAFHGGAAVVALGVTSHFLIATGAATVYYLVSLKQPLLVRKPWLCGPVFGIGLYIFMHYFVLPLSGVPHQSAPTLAWVLNQLFSHTIFVGLPIALVTRWSATRRDSTGRNGSEANP
jgi:hypothetical protein